MKKSMKRISCILTPILFFIIQSCNNEGKTNKPDTNTTKMAVVDTTHMGGVKPLFVPNIPSFEISKTYLQTLYDGGRRSLSISVAFTNITKPSTMRLIISAMQPGADPILVPLNEITVLADPAGEINNTVIIGNTVITLNEILYELGVPRVYDRLILRPVMCSNASYPDNMVLGLKGINAGQAPTVPGMDLQESKPSPPAPPVIYFKK